MINWYCPQGDTNNTYLMRYDERGYRTMKRNTIFGNYFCGNEISEYGKENGYVDYATLAKAFDAVLNNTIITKSDDWELRNGYDYDEETDTFTFAEVFQYYIISESGAELLADYTNELVYYSYDLDVYLWGVTHYGTSWDYVLTEIPCKAE